MARTTGTGNRSKTSSKRTSTRSKSSKGRTSGAKGKKRQNDDKPLSDDLRYEIVVLVFIAVSLLLIISVYFNAGGKVGETVQAFLFGVFGISAYLIPVFILVSSFLKVFNKGNLRLNYKLSLIFIGFIVVSTFGHLYYIEDAQLNMTISDRSTFFASTAIYYKMSASEHIAGGMVGGVVGDLFEILIGKVGSYIILVMISLSLVILVTEQSLAGIGRALMAAGQWIANLLFNAGKKGVERAGEQIKIYNDNMQKERELRKEEREHIKKEKQKDLLAKATLPEDAGKAADEPESKKLFNRERTTKPSFKSGGNDPFEQIIEQEEAELAKEHESIPIPGPVKFSTDTMSFEPIVEEKPEKVKPVAVEAIQTEINTEETAKKVAYRLPPMELMKENTGSGSHNSQSDIDANSHKLIEVLASFGVQAKMLDVSVGPTVTRYELQPAAGVKVSKIVNLQDDLALGLAANGIRIEAPIPGKSAVGIEVPNLETQAVYLREVIDTPEFAKFPSKIGFALGKDISGKVMLADIARMPHMLIAGATGSGKSVCVNTLITSILYKSTPDEVKLLMIDPKVVELSAYNGIPHLLIPVVTDPKKAAGALNWAVQEMSDRYKLFAAANVRDLKGYNNAVEENREGKKLPQIVIIVDELADLMMVAPNDVEDAICRLAQMARAAGLHLIIATQRPSVDVITGLIKANIPSRIAFNVSSGTDSRTIIDSYGAEKLLGKGDMLFYPVGLQKPVRVQGAFISDKEVENIVTFLKDQAKAVYNEKIMNQLSKDTEAAAGGAAGGSDYDAYFNEALDLVIEKQKASASMIQRRFRVGYNRAARIVDQLFEAGFIGDEEGSKPRKVLMTRDEYAAMKDEAAGGGDTAGGTEMSGGSNGSTGTSEAGGNESAGSGSIATTRSRSRSDDGGSMFAAPSGSDVEGDVGLSTRKDGTQLSVDDNPF